MQHFTPWSALAGGGFIGLAASLLLISTGHGAGVSGVVDGVLHRRPPGWRWTFLGGLVLGGLLMRALRPEWLPGLQAPTLTLALAGLAVGFGTRVGGGCTSGHGIVGNSRLSPRSVVATLTFMGAGFATVALLRALHV